MSKLYINTTQNVKLFFTTASIGDRMLAYLLDLLIKGAYVVVVYFLFIFSFDLSRMGTEGRWILMALMALVALPVVFYTLLSETFMAGQTLGKKLLKIRVVKMDGYQAGFSDFLIRWLFTIVDIHIGYVPGLISMVASRNTQRLGDLAAGTAVVSEKSKYDISHTILMEVDDKYVPYFSQNQVLLFSDNDMRIIKECAETAFKQVNYELIDRLIAQIESVMSIRNPFKDRRELIVVLQKDYNYYTGK